MKYYFISISEILQVELNIKYFHWNKTVFTMFSIILKQNKTLYIIMTCLHHTFREAHDLCDKQRISPSFPDRQEASSASPSPDIHSMFNISQKKIGNALEVAQNFGGDTKSIPI